MNNKDKTNNTRRPHRVKTPGNQKDIVEKNLESENDVFADILNVLVLSEDEQLDIHHTPFIDELPRSMFKADGGLHENERDVIKTMMGTTIQIITIGYENQTQADRFMAARIMGYDGISYQKQYLQIKEGAAKAIHPVITYVLYFGEDRNYEGVYSLLDCIDLENVPKSLVKDLQEQSNYKFKVFNIPNMTAEQIEKFQSDFRSVADYFSQKRRTGAYQPDTHPIRHVDKFLKTMQVLLKDDRFDLHLDKEETNMCEILDIVENRGMAKGIEIGKDQVMSNLRKARKYLKEHQRSDEIDKLFDDNSDFLNEILRAIDEENQFSA